MNLRIILAAAAATTLAMLAPGVASAQPDGTSVPVCNTASPHFLGGPYDATDQPVQNPPSRYVEDLYALPGLGEGLVNAATHSPALSVCAPGDDGSGDNGGGDTGGGIPGDS